MILLLAEHTNGEVSFVGTVGTMAQARIVAEAIVQSPSWKDVFFMPVTSPQAIAAAKDWTVNYFIDNPPLQKKLADDPFLQLLLKQREEDDEPGPV